MQKENTPHLPQRRSQWLRVESPGKQLHDNLETVIVAVRHGETAWNLADRFQGHGDSPLTETGIAQVQAAGLHLKNFAFDELISSDLGRARESAGHIAKLTGHSIRTDERLRERNFGILEGLTLAQIRDRHPDIFDRLCANDSEYMIPEGESLQQHYRRNIAFLEEFVSERAGASAVLVVHGGVLDSFFRFVSRMPLHQPRCFVAGNGGISRFAHGIFYESLRWVIRAWNETTHLKGISTQDWPER